MKVLITGAGGFLGTHLRAELKAKGVSFDIVRRIRASCKTALAVNEVAVDWPQGLARLDLSSYAAIFHLAIPPFKENADPASLSRDALLPVELFVQNLTAANSGALFIFVSSQSAGPAAQSQYGQLKWQGEELLRASGIRWTVVRPGLIFGPGSSGLFSRIMNFINHSPVVPLIGSGDQLIQPIPVSTVAQALVKVVEERERLSGKTIALAGPEIQFREFLKLACAAKGKKRLFLRVPEPLIAAALRSMEIFLSNPPLTFSNLAACKYLLPALGMLQIFYPDRPAPDNYLTLKPDGGLNLVYSEKRALNLEPRFITAMLKLGFLSLPQLCKKPKPGSSIHYAGGLPMRENPGKPYETRASDGLLFGTKRVHISDAATFPRLPSKNLTFTIMANAMRMAKEAKRSSTAG